MRSKKTSKGEEGIFSGNSSIFESASFPTEQQFFDEVQQVYISRFGGKHIFIFCSHFDLCLRKNHIFVLCIWDSEEDIFLGEDEGGPVRTLVFRRSHFGVSSMPEGLGVDVPLPVLWPDSILLPRHLLRSDPLTLPSLQDLPK